jgi:hypothetical protein
MSIFEVETTVATPEAKDAPEDRPLSDVPENHDKSIDSCSDPEGQPSHASHTSHPQGTQSESLMSIFEVETTVATPEAKDAPEDRPLSDVPDSQNHDKSIDPCSDPEGQPSQASQASRPRGTQLESLMSIFDVETTVATPEAKDAPEDRPISDVPENHDKYRDVQPQRLSGEHRHDADMRLHHLFQKAGVVAEHLYMDCDAGMVRMVGILVVICIALYHLGGGIIYALRDQDMVY